MAEMADQPLTLAQLQKALDQQTTRLENAFEAQLEARLAKTAAELKTYIHQQMDAYAASIEEFARDLQTETLNAMVSAQQGNDARFRELEALRDRVNVMENRLNEMEKRLANPLKFPRPPKPPEDSAA